jgi:hypothetical protein
MQLNFEYKKYILYSIYETTHININLPNVHPV